MSTYDVKRLVVAGSFVALTVGGWVGCSVEGAPSKAVEKLASTSQALAPSSSGGTGTSGNSDAGPPPMCANGPKVTVWARCHESSDVVGYLTPYTDPFPLPYEADGGAVNSNATVYAYEEAVWNDILGANGYAYQISQTEYPQSDADFSVAVGINQETTSPTYSMTPTAGNQPYSGEPPRTSDWDEEYELANEYSSVSPVYSQYLECVEVVALGNGTSAEGCLPRGTHIEFFPLLDHHDPNGPNWVLPPGQGN
jgi:hypothetical protein